MTQALILSASKGSHEHAAGAASGGAACDGAEAVNDTETTGERGGDKEALGPFRIGFRRAPLHSTAVLPSCLEDLGLGLGDGLRAGDGLSRALHLGGHLLGVVAVHLHELHQVELGGLVGHQHAGGKGGKRRSVGWR